MTYNKRNSILFFAFLCSILAMVFSVNDLERVAFWFSFVSGVFILIVNYKLTKKLILFSNIFLCFSILYGCSGPFSVLYAEGLHFLYPKPYYVSDYIFHYSLSNVGIIIGFIFYKFFCIEKKEKFDSLVSGYNFLNAAIVFSFLSFVMEFINIYRIGGLGTLIKGKAFVQSSISDLFITLPSYNFLYVSVFLFGIFLVQSKKNEFRTHKVKYILFLTPIFFVLLSYIFLGQRGRVAIAIVGFLLAITWFVKQQKVKFKHILLILIVYIFMVLMVGVRGKIGYVVQTGNWDIIKNDITNSEFWLSNINPGTTEFGCTFGNFNAYILNDFNKLRWGYSYISGLSIVIPRFIWPNKPQSVVYEFRDKFFFSESLRGRIAGTAYSSILEAYENFGTFGVFFVYSIYGIFLRWIEYYRRINEANVKHMIFYAMLLPVAISFHRSAFGFPIFWPLVMTFSVSFFMKCSKKP